MKAVVFLGEGKIEIRDYPYPKPGPDEVIVRMKASGMCGSDLHNLHEPKRSAERIVIEGHEPCGVVEEVGSAALRVVNRIRSGVMWVNCYGMIDPVVGFTGAKTSGYGAKASAAHLDTYLQTKSVYIQL